MSVSASAAPVGFTASSAVGVLVGEKSSQIIKIRSERRWRRGRHGNRFRGRRRGFTHFYDGFYYAVPWWEDDYYDDGGDDYGRGRGGGDHEDWCSSRYKSYKPRSNTWTDYDGNTRECVSPFD